MFVSFPNASCYITETSNAYPNRVYRSLKFGVNVTPELNYAWSEFSRVDISGLATKTELSALNEKLFPLGGIIMWSGQPNALPVGFALCDGTNGTPDLRGRFVVGYDGRPNVGDPDYATVGNQGGEKKHLLTKDELAAHEHAGDEHFRFHVAFHGSNDNIPVPGTQGAKYKWYGNATASSMDSSRSDLLGANELMLINSKPDAGAAEEKTVGGNAPHENRPPYYVLAYIMRVL